MKIRGAYSIKFTSITLDDPAKRYGSLKPLGSVVTEAIPGKDSYRYLLEGASSFRAAVQLLAKIKQKGFPEAVIVVYENGRRMGVNK